MWQLGPKQSQKIELDLCQNDAYSYAILAFSDHTTECDIYVLHVWYICNKCMVFYVYYTCNILIFKTFSKK